MFRVTLRQSLGVRGVVNESRNSTMSDEDFSIERGRGWPGGGERVLVNSRVHLGMFCPSCAHVLVDN